MMTPGACESVDLQTHRFPGMFRYSRCSPADGEPPGAATYITLNASSDTRNTTMIDEDMIVARTTVRKNISRLASL